ncbi:hypothetical protein [Aquimarina sp. 2304DJ70-9]|uniref:hypothetical protein n=1 Tax=Aquimarina penaris TaxID=3231044 RepID=UPI0034620085
MKCFIVLLASIFLIQERCVTSKKMMDSNLIDQLHNAINAKTSVCNIGTIVDTKPLINTCNEKDRLILNRADFDFDPDDRNSFLDIKKALDVSYWKVEHPTKVKIIGICWFTDGSIKLFKAIVLPP